MSCTDNVCGTGGWGGPKPGDPDNNIALSANTVYGGIDVSWSYPASNPAAVAHTLLYRGTTSVFDQAVQRAVVAGSIYYDKTAVTVDTEYYYWIRIVSVNGTTLDPVGPVSATMKPLATQTLESLTGLIDEGVLAQALRADITSIDGVHATVIQEIQDRLAANAAFASFLAEVQDNVGQAVTLIHQETTQRTDGDNALAESINILAAGNGDAMAAIEEETRVRVSSDAALAEQLDSMLATIGDSSSGLIHDVQVAATQASASASDVETLQSIVDGNVATGQIGLTTKIETLNGKVTEIGALYTAKVQVNGLIGGFGIYNDGSLVEAGFDVDRFWVGRTNDDKVKPFIIDNDIVYINKARIKEADIDTLLIAGNAVTMAVSSYTAGVTSYSTAVATVQSLTMTTTGAPVLVGFGCHIDPPGYTSDGSDGSPGGTVVTSTWSAALLRDGVQLYSCDGPKQPPPNGGMGMAGTVYFQLQDTPSAGTHTYTIQVTTTVLDSHGVDASNRIIHALEVKR